MRHPPILVFPQDYVQGQSLVQNDRMMVMNWLSENYKWLFDGVAGAAVIAVIGYVVHRFLGSQDRQQGVAALTAQGAKVTNSPVASGTNISQTINSPTVNLSLPTPLQARESETPRCDFWLQFHPQGSRSLFVQNNGAEPAFDTVVYVPADGSGFKSDVIHRLDSDRAWVACLLKGNFFSMESARNVLVEALLHPPDGGEEVRAIPVLIRYRTHTQHSCAFHLEIRLPLQNGIQFALPEVVEERANRTRVEAESQLIGRPAEVEVAEISTSGRQQDGGADADRKFARLAIDEARKSVAEDERPHPKVGAVVVKDGVVLCKAHRGEILKSHAEYIALDEKLSDDVVAGTTVYTTLEPCTTRKHPKIPCAQRLIDRRVACVVIGMLDPNPEISGKGWQLLREAGIEIRVFDHDLMQLCEEM